MSGGARGGAAGGTGGSSTSSDGAGDVGTGISSRVPPLGVLVDPDDRARDRQRSVTHYGGYAVEILEHGGFAFQTLTRADLDASRYASAPPLPPIVLIPYPVRLTGEEAASLEAHARSGGAVIACGGVEGADALFGIASTRRYLDEAALDWPQGGLGLAAFRAPVWGAHVARASAPAGAGATPGGPEGARPQGADRPESDRPAPDRPEPDGLEPDATGAAEPLGEVRGPHGESGVAAAIRRVGSGHVCWLGVDVARSVVTMQQGRPVVGDARSAPDGTAAIADGILKTDDGAVIDWAWRRDGPEGPYFAEPFADRLRELLLGAVVHCAERIGVLLPVKGYWPDGLPAVAALSYDTDSNVDADGWAFLETVQRLDVAGTWCVMYPGGYSRALYDAIGAYGDEIALHYDALTSDLDGSPRCGWSPSDFAFQLAWLKEATGVERIASQKNHVTRWEGWVEFFRWVERAGIAVDQTKGPSKIGNLGFTFGTCHPWRPMEDALHDHRRLDVLELAFHTHDMHHSQRRVELRRVLLDAAVRHHGVAHFIFHPQRIHEDGMREALADVVEAARARDVPWWTSERIAQWERARREARVHVGPGSRIEAADAPEGLTVLLFGRDPDAGAAPPGTTWVEALGRRVRSVSV